MTFPIALKHRYLVTVGWVVRYLPEGISVLDANHGAILAELAMRQEQEARHRELWGNSSARGASIPFDAAVSPSGVSIWVCEGKLPHHRHWLAERCIRRDPDLSVALPSILTPAQLSLRAESILGIVAGMDGRSENVVSQAFSGNGARLVA